MNQLRQGIDVRALELGVVPVLDDLRRQRMQQRQLFEHFGVHARAGLRPLDDRQLQLLEQQLAELNPRVDVELAAGDLKDLPLQPHDPLVELAGQLAQPRHIDADAVELHLGQHVDQRHLQVGEQLVQAAALSAAARARSASRSGTSASSAAYCVISGTGTSSIRFWFLPRADELVDRDRLVAEMAAGHVVHVVAPLARIEQVVGHHRVERDAAQLDADAPQHDHVVLQVLADLLDRADFPAPASAPRARAAGSSCGSPAGARTGM